MHPSLWAYNAVLGLATPALLPLWGATRAAGKWPELWPRLGLFRHVPPPGPGPRVWLQAVSVGEVRVAANIAAELWARRPELCLTVSTTTATGLAEARRLLGHRARVIPFPLDFPWAVAAAVSRVRPAVYASVETEIWPNLWAALKRSGARLLLLNGRLSARSFPRYRRIRPLIAPSLASLDALGMIGPADAERAVALGADPARVTVAGNAKYAGLLAQADPARTAEPAARLDLAGRPLVVAGSVRSGEEAPVLDAFRQLRAAYPQAVLVVAPRHVERAPRWLEAARERSLSAARWTGLSTAQPRPEGASVVVVDVMGQLMGLYGLAACAFVGASLVPLGGQNPLEPAAWGVAPTHGPDLGDFADARAALHEAGAAREVTGAAELAAAWAADLADPAAASRRGEAARRVVDRWSGAATAAARMILAQPGLEEARA